MPDCLMKRRYRGNRSKFWASSAREAVPYCCRAAVGHHPGRTISRSAVVGRMNDAWRHAYYKSHGGQVMSTTDIAHIGWLPAAKRKRPLTVGRVRSVVLFTVGDRRAPAEDLFPASFFSTRCLSNPCRPLHQTKNNDIKKNALLREKK